jgi:DNA-directed RNA polymerase specialized sigma24 family protein
MPYDEIAQIMEIPIGTLKTWMFRARKELRTIVQQELEVQA